MCKRLERIQRDFLRGRGNWEQKPLSCQVSHVCTEKNKGGLGVRGLPRKNKALLCKWNWRVANKRDSLFGGLSLAGSLESLQRAGARVS